jgi:hypothetical protein
MRMCAQLRMPALRRAQPLGTSTSRSSSSLVVSATMVCRASTCAAPPSAGSSDTSKADSSAATSVRTCGEGGGAAGQRVGQSARRARRLQRKLPWCARQGACLAVRPPAPSPPSCPAPGPRSSWGRRRKAGSAARRWRGGKPPPRRHPTCARAGGACGAGRLGWGQCTQAGRAGAAAALVQGRVLRCGGTPSARGRRHLAARRRGPACPPVGVELLGVAPQRVGVVGDVHGAPDHGACGGRQRARRPLIQRRGPRAAAAEKDTAAGCVTAGALRPAPCAAHPRARARR